MNKSFRYTFIQDSLKQKNAGAGNDFSIFALQKKGRGGGPMLESLSSLSNVSSAVWCLIRVSRGRRWRRHNGCCCIADSSYPAGLGGACKELTVKLLLVFHGELAPPGSQLPHQLKDSLGSIYTILMYFVSHDPLLPRPSWMRARQRVPLNVGGEIIFL